MTEIAATAFVAPKLGSTRLITACTIGNALEFYDFGDLQLLRRHHRGGVLPRTGRHLEAGS